MTKEMKMKFFRLFLVGLAILLLTACGGGGSTTDSHEKETINSNKKNIKVNIDDLKVDTTKLLISSGSKSKPYSSETDLNITKERKAVIGVFKDNQPILLGRKIVGEDSVEVSLESSAEIFVLYHPRFNGVESNNPKELSHRIRTHKKFKKLVNQLKEEIEGKNPCPMDPICSPKVKYIAFDIADDLNISDLYK
jgi:hypothetical protein